MAGERPDVKLIPKGLPNWRRGGTKKKLRIKCKETDQYQERIVGNVVMGKSVSKKAVVLKIDR